MVVDEERKKSIWMSSSKYALISQSAAKCLSYRALIKVKAAFTHQTTLFISQTEGRKIYFRFFLFNHTSQANGMLLFEKDFYLRVIFTRVAIYEGIN